MINKEDIIEDLKSDEIGNKINNVQNQIPGSILKKEALAELCILLQKSNYVSFKGDATNYAKIRVGESILYKVPPKKTGHLMVFRGSLVRIVCVGSGRYDRRSYMAGVVAGG